MDTVTILLIISLLLNVGLVYYSALAARRLFLVSTNLDTLYSLISAFKAHTESVHESEMFYGDTTLLALIEHSKEILDELDSYDDLMAIVYEEEEEESAEKEG